MGWCWWAGGLVGGQNWIGLTRERRVEQLEPAVLQVLESKMKRWRNAEQAPSGKIRPSR